MNTHCEHPGYPACWPVGNGMSFLYQYPVRVLLLAKSVRLTGGYFSFNFSTPFEGRQQLIQFDDLQSGGIEHRFRKMLGVTLPFCQVDTQQ